MLLILVYSSNASVVFYANDNIAAISIGECDYNRGEIFASIRKLFRSNCWPSGVAAKILMLFSFDIMSPILFKFKNSPRNII